MFPQDSHFPPIGRMIMPRPSMCHTSSLQTPIDKEQALQISVSGCVVLDLIAWWSNSYTDLFEDAAGYRNNTRVSKKCHVINDFFGILISGPLLCIWFLAFLCLFDLSCRSRTCCHWLAPCCRPGRTPCWFSPHRLRPCLTLPKTAFPTRSRSCRSTPKAWETAWIFYLARYIGAKNTN